MAIQWMDNFAIYGQGGQADMSNGPYANVAGVGTAIVRDPDPNTPSTACAFKCGYGVLEVLRKVLPITATVVGVAARIWQSSLPIVANDYIFPFVVSDGGNVSLCSIMVDTTGAIVASNGSGTVLGRTPGPVLVANAWQHVEAKFVLHATAGSVEVRVDSQTVLALTNVNTLGAQAGPAAQVSYRNNSGATNPVTYIKDYIIWDNTTTQNADFLGSCQVLSLVPSSDVSLNWTPSHGTAGWSLLNESPPDDDAGYISAANPPPAAAVLGLTDLPLDVTSVRGLMALVRSKKTDAGDANLQVSLNSGASTVAGANRPITTAYTYWNDLFPLDPATGNAWLPGAVNAANLKLNRTA